MPAIISKGRGSSTRISTDNGSPCGNQIQQGLFLAPGDVTKSFLSNLGSLKSVGDVGSDLTRYVIPRSRRRVVARSLYRMNVTETTLFPGLDGFARSLWMYPEIRESGEST
jgi:hypothetical protein